jgi:hypothetical protein
MKAQTGTKRFLYITVVLLSVFNTVSVAQDQKWNKHYYMMNAGDTRELPAGNYSSSDENCLYGSTQPFTAATTV